MVGQEEIYPKAKIAILLLERDWASMKMLILYLPLA